MPRNGSLHWTVRHLAGAADLAQAVGRIVAPDEPFFWLDTARVVPGLSRLSVLGTSAGDDAEILRYDVGSDEPSIFDTLADRIAARTADATPVPHVLADRFAGGYVGFFGYELKALTGGDDVHRSDQPDAVWFWANRFVVVDHESGDTWVVALDAPADEAAGAWVERTARAIAAPPVATAPQAEPAAFSRDDIVRALETDRAGYVASIDRVHELLNAGESYEVCLTNRVRLPAVEDPLAFYLAQRERNPAPFASFVRLDDWAVASSSPERFLSVGADRVVECKPIKGTVARGADADADALAARSLQRDPKSRAENLMIVDLIRNDLSRACEAGSVHVPVLMGVESYETVHQLVSTIRGTLKPGRSAVDAVRESFPPGSMTGAPKVRTMAIIDDLERSARGIYSGVLGYFGLDGRADLSVVIRTAVCTPQGTTVGAGGAVILASDAADEYDEMLLKAQAPLSAQVPA